MVTQPRLRHVWTPFLIFSFSSLHLSAFLGGSLGQLDQELKQLAKKLGLKRRRTVRDFLLDRRPPQTEYITHEGASRGYFCTAFVGNVSFQGAVMKSAEEAKQSAAFAALWALQHPETAETRVKVLRKPEMEGYFRVPLVASASTSRRRVLGMNGTNMKYIRQESGARVTLVGKGSQCRSRKSGKELDVPLSIYISGSGANFTRAGVLVHDLLTSMSGQKRIQLHLGSPYKSLG